MKDCNLGAFVEDAVSTILNKEIARLAVISAALDDCEFGCMAMQVTRTIKNLKEALSYVDEEWSEDDD